MDFQRRPQRVCPEGGFRGAARGSPALWRRSGEEGGGGEEGEGGEEGRGGGEEGDG